MTKRQLIDEIMTINRSARPSFLAEFDDRDLSEYLAHLLAVAGPRPQGDPWWPDRHLKDRPAAPPRPAADREDPPAQAAREPDADTAELLADSIADDRLDEATGETVLAAASASHARPSHRRAPRVGRTSEKWLF